MSALSTFSNAPCADTGGDAIVTTSERCAAYAARASRNRCWPWDVSGLFLAVEGGWDGLLSDLRDHATGGPLDVDERVVDEWLLSLRLLHEGHRAEVEDLRTRLSTACLALEEAANALVAADYRPAAELVLRWAHGARAGLDAPPPTCEFLGSSSLPSSPVGTTPASEALCAASPS